MKKILFLILTTMLYLNSTFAQLRSADILNDSNGNAICYKYQFIIKFNPSILKKSVINDTSIKSGLVSDFIDSTLLVFLIENNYLDTSISNMTMTKIFPTMSTNDTLSIARDSSVIKVPAYWSTFLLYWNANNASNMNYLQAVDSLNNLKPFVEYAELNYLYKLQGIANDSYFLNSQRSLFVAFGVDGSIYIKDAWDYAWGTDNVKVGIYDGGINYGHFDLTDDYSGHFSKTRVKGGYDYYNLVSIFTNGNNDRDGHGTAIAGIIGAVKDNGQGIAGIAGGDGAQPGVKIYDMKIAENGSYITLSKVANAIYQGALSYNNNGNGLNVMNHSWGGVANNVTLTNQFNFAFRNGCTLVAASGNSDPNHGITNTTKMYPASLRKDWVMKVGANDGNNAVPAFSIYDNDLDFVAPGVQTEIKTIDYNNDQGYNFIQTTGTSFSAAHASGMAALMISYISNNSLAPNSLSHEDVEQLIEKNAKLVNQNNQTYSNISGYGKVDAGNTIKKMLLPKYQVKHYNAKVSNSTAVLTGGNTGAAFNLTFPAKGLSLGTYIGDIYKVTSTFSLNLPSTATVLGVWARNSASDLYAHSGFVFPFSDITITAQSS